MYITILEIFGGASHYPEFSLKGNIIKLKIFQSFLAAVNFCRD